MATKVTLHTKPISGNRESLYFDLYPEIINSKTGQPTRREFLNMYIMSEIEYEEIWKTSESGKSKYKIFLPVLNKFGQPKQRKLSVIEKQHNKNTWELAEQIKLRRENEINKPLIYSDLERERLKVTECEKGNFVDYFKELADNKNTKEKENFNVVYKYLKDYTNGILQFKDLDERFCDEFKNYLLKLKAYNSEKLISQNTACTYFVKFKAGVKQAAKDKKIPFNVGTGVSTIKLIESQRNFLTLDELNKLVKTDCFDPLLKKAFLFSALSGLRKGDILKLTWGEIELINKQHAIRFREQKTKKNVTVYIHDQAFKLLGKPGKPEDKVFPGLKINSYYSRYLLLWMSQAGISKKISFHCARHSLATNQLSSGTAMATVSKMLGHKNIKTTEIYAKVIDLSILEAVARIKLDF